MSVNRNIEEWPSDEQQKAYLAAQVFGESLVIEVRDIPRKAAVRRLLAPEAKLEDDEKALSAWLQSKGADERKTILKFAEYVVDMTLFRMLALLDGAVGGCPLDDRTADYFIALGIYTSEEEYEAGEPSELIRLNAPDKLDLHDYYKEWVKRFSKENEAI